MLFSHPAQAASAKTASLRHRAWPGSTALQLWPSLGTALPAVVTICTVLAAALNPVYADGGAGSAGAGGTGGADNATTAGGTAPTAPFGGYGGGGGGAGTTGGAGGKGNAGLGAQRSPSTGRR